MENIEEFNVADTMLWQKVKEGLTRKWLENAADNSDIDYLVDIYNDCYDGGIFDNIEDAVYDTFSDVYDAFQCAVDSEGNYDKYDSWFQIPHYENTLYSWSDSSMLDKLIDEMSSDIKYLAENIEDNKVDEDHTYRDIVKDISLTQRYYANELEVINGDLLKHIEASTYEGYMVSHLKEDCILHEENTTPYKFVLKSAELSKLIADRNNGIKALLDNNSKFLKGALYSLAIENNAQSLTEIESQLNSVYGIDYEFRENHKEEIDEVNLNLAKIGEFIQ